MWGRYCITSENQYASNTAKDNYAVWFRTNNGRYVGYPYYTTVYQYQGLCKGNQYVEIIDENRFI